MAGRAPARRPGSGVQNMRGGVLSGSLVPH